MQKDIHESQTSFWNVSNSAEEIENNGEIVSNQNQARDILLHVYRALQDKGYNPITQLTGYITTGEPTFITSHNQARILICRLDREEIVEELLNFYLKEGNI